MPPKVHLILGAPDRTRLEGFGTNRAKRLAMVMQRYPKARANSFTSSQDE